MREFRNEVCGQGRLNTCKFNFNQACAVYAFANITAMDLIRSFNVTVIYPFKRDFPMQFRNV